MAHRREQVEALVVRARTHLQTVFKLYDAALQQRQLPPDLLIDVMIQCALYKSSLDYLIRDIADQ